MSQGIQIQDKLRPSNRWVDFNGKNDKQNLPMPGPHTASIKESWEAAADKWFSSNSQTNEYDISWEELSTSSSGSTPTSLSSSPENINASSNSAMYTKAKQRELSSSNPTKFSPPTSHQSVQQKLSLSLAQEVTEYLERMNIKTSFCLPLIEEETSQRATPSSSKFEEHSAFTVNLVENGTTNNAKTVQESIKNEDHKTDVESDLDVRVGDLVLHRKTSRCGVVIVSSDSDELVIRLSSGHEVHTTSSRVNIISARSIVEVMNLSKNSSVEDVVFIARTLLKLAGLSISDQQQLQSFRCAVEVVLVKELGEEYEAPTESALQGVTEEVFLGYAGYLLEFQGVGVATEVLAGLLEKRPACSRGREMLDAMMGLDNGLKAPKPLGTEVTPDQGDATSELLDSAILRYGGTRIGAHLEEELFRAPGCRSSASKYLKKKVRSRCESEGSKSHRSSPGAGRRRHSATFGFRRPIMRRHKSSQSQCSNDSDSENEPVREATVAPPSPPAIPSSSPACPEEESLPDFLSEHQCAQLRSESPTEREAMPTVGASPCTPVTSEVQTNFARVDSTPPVGEVRTNFARMERSRYAARREHRGFALEVNPAESVRRRNRRLEGNGTFRRNRRCSDPGQPTRTSGWLPRQGKKLVAAASRRFPPRSRRESSTM